MHEGLARVRVWDGWVRFVHWAVVALLGLSWWSAETERWDLHLLSGEAVLALLLFRLAWGFVGSDTARFARFLRSPPEALRHLRHLHRREPDREIGHNAAGGWMVLALLGLLLAQVLTGLFANHDAGFTYAQHGPLTEYLPEAWQARLTALHAWLFTGLQVAVALHVLAVLAYAVLKRQDLVRPMITGVKRLPATLRAPRLAHPLLGAALLGAAAAAAWGVTRLG